MKDKLKLKVGGIYLNKIGQKVKITSKCRINKHYPYVDKLDNYYTPSGLSIKAYAAGCFDDLVEDITPQAIDFIMEDE